MNYTWFHVCEAFNEKLPVYVVSLRQLKEKRGRREYLNNLPCTTLVKIGRGIPSWFFDENVL